MDQMPREDKKSQIWQPLVEGKIWNWKTLCVNYMNMKEKKGRERGEKGWKGGKKEDSSLLINQ